MGAITNGKNKLLEVTEVVFILIGLMVSLLKHTSKLSYTLNMLFTVHQLYLNKIVKTIILGRSKGIDSKKTTTILIMEVKIIHFLCRHVFKEYV